MGYLPQKQEGRFKAKPDSIILANSSFLQGAVYDESAQSLTLDFKSGLQQVHVDVELGLWQQLRLARSPGSFYNKAIKGKYSVIDFRSPLKVSDLTKAKKASNLPARRGTMTKPRRTNAAEFKQRS